MKRIICALSALVTGIAAVAHTAEDSLKLQDIEEIVVVYTPKETSRLRETPVSVSLFDAATLEKRQTRSLKELSSSVPNFYMPDYGSSLTSAAYIRGVGSRMNTPAVGLYVDHVAYADKSAYDIQLLDVARIDVLRGPQATLYGRNSMGGVLRIFTKNPFETQGTDVRLGYSIQDIGIRTSFSHHHRYNDHVALSASAFYNRSEGFFKNSTTGESVGGEHSGGARMRFIWKPTTAWTLDFTTDYSHREDNGYPYRYLGATDAAHETMSGHIGSIFYNDPSFYRRGLFNAGLHVQHTAPRYIMSSVTAYQHLKDNMTLDQDFTDRNLFRLTQKQRIASWSEELSFKSRFNRRWQWTGGLYALRQANRTTSPVTLTEQFMGTIFDKANEAMSPMGMGIEMNMHDPKQVLADGAFKMPVTDLALFHQSTFNDLFGIEGFSLIAGIRLEYEHLTLDYDYGADISYDLNITSPMMPVRLNGLHDKSPFLGGLEHDYLQLLPKVALQYRFNDTGHMYVSWSKGSRSGGYNVQMFSDLVQGDLRSSMMGTIKDATAEYFNRPMFAAMPDKVKQMVLGMIPQYEFTGSPAQTRYKPEYSYNYEVGTHLSLADGMLQLDAAAFYMDIHDQQISKFVSSGLGRVMVNAGRGQSYGLEASLLGSHFDRRLTWNASYGFTHSTFKTYEAQAATETEEAVRYDGNYVPFVPMHTMAAGVEYSQPLHNRKVHRLLVGVNTHGAGRIYWDEKNDCSQSFYALLDAHIGMDFGKTRIDLWGKNLTDSRYNTFLFTSEATTRELRFAQRGRPLQMGVDIRFRF